MPGCKVLGDTDGESVAGLGVDGDWDVGLRVGISRVRM